MGQAASTQPCTSDMSNDQLNKVYSDEIQRQIALKSLQFERELAYRKAQDVESFAWEFLAGATSMIAVVALAQHRRNKFFALPVVPIVMYVGYRYDHCFGDSNGRIVKTAERLLTESPEVLRPLGGPITLAELDRRRAAWRKPPPPPSDEASV